MDLYNCFIFLLRVLRFGELTPTLSAKETALRALTGSLLFNHNGVKTTCVATTPLE